MNLIKKAFDFKGRSTRKSFWLFSIITRLVQIVFFLPLILLMFNIAPIIGTDSNFTKSATQLGDSFMLFFNEPEAGANSSEAKQFEKAILDYIDNLGSALESKGQAIVDEQGILIIVVIVSTVLGLLYFPLMIIPWVSIAVRRLRDAGFHPAWVFLILAEQVLYPFIGPICSLALIVMLLFPTKKEQAPAPEQLPV